jgi:hypothetical protein
VTTATFTVRLTSQPSASMTIAVTSSDPTEGTVSPTTLTFTTSNWSTPQTVTVTGVDDMVVDNAQTYQVILASPVTADTVYAALNPPDVSVTNNDNDTNTNIAGFTIDYAGHAYAFLAFACLTLIPIAILLLHSGLTRVSIAKLEHETERRALDLLRNPPLRRVIVTSGLIVAAYELFGFYMPVFGHSAGLSASAIGLIMGAYGSRSRGTPPLDIAGFLRAQGFPVAGATMGGDPPLTAFAWIDNTPEDLA